MMLHHGAIATTGRGGRCPPCVTRDDLDAYGRVQISNDTSLLILHKIKIFIIQQLTNIIFRFLLCERHSQCFVC